jgi:hypothetical protein
MAVFAKLKSWLYLQCIKRLWLEAHKPEFQTDSSATASFANGNALGDAPGAHKEHPTTSRTRILGTGDASTTNSNFN